MKKVFVVLGVLILLSAGNVWASGLAIPEQGAAAMAMSAAMTARSEDLSSIFYNPAGIDYVEGLELFAGITPIMPGHKYSPLREDSKIFSKKEAESNTFLPPQLYAAFRAHRKIVLGLGVYAPFGLGTEWDKEWAGRYTSTLAEIQTVYINPTIAINVNEKVSLGLGASYITSNATIEKMVDTGGSLAAKGFPASMMANTDYDSHFALDGDGSAFAINAGVLIKPVERVQLGVSYRWAYDIEYEGKAKFTHKNALKALPAGVGITAYDVVSAQMPASQDGKATLHMPWMLNLGVLYELTEVWDASFDVDFVGWERYDELTIDFDDDKPLDKQTQDKDWKNSFILRAGTSYDFNESFVGRGGVMFDKNPVPDETMDGQLPDSNRFGFSLGAGYKLGKIQLDASYLILFFSDREKENGVGFGSDVTGDGVINRFDVLPGYPVGNGNYESRAHLISVSASYKF